MQKELKKKLLSNPNLEVVFSLPDLYEAALQADDIEQRTRALKKWKTNGLTEEELREYQDYWRSQERNKLGFMKMLIGKDSDQIVGFTAFGIEASELMAAVQTAMVGRLPYTVLRDAMFAHPTMSEGLVFLLQQVEKRKS